MTMAPLPQVAQDLPALLDPVIQYASRAGEHKGVMQQSVTMHRLEKNIGDVFKGAHVAKIEAVHGGPRTRFTNTARYSAEVWDCHLGYTVSLISLADNQKEFLNKHYLRQLGSQQGEAIARDVDRILLGTFQTFTVTKDSSGNPIKAFDLEQQFFRLEAAEDDIDDMIQIVTPTAHLRDLIVERTTTNTTSALTDAIASNYIQRPLTADAARALGGTPRYSLHGSMLKQARNSPKFGSNGYTALFRKPGIHMVTANVLMREMERQPRDGGGASTTIVRKLWGYRVPPHGLRSWCASVQARMDIGGR